MPEVGQRREQLPRAVAEQLPTRARTPAVDADAVRAAKVRRNAWLLAGFALFFYFGYMAWMLVRTSGG